jgi:hypothetical protein
MSTRSGPAFRPCHGRAIRPPAHRPGDDANAAFAITADRFPRSWEAWDGLAEGLVKAAKVGIKAVLP